MSSKVVMIWVRVPVKSANGVDGAMYARFTRSPEYATAFVKQARALGFRCRYEHNFVGRTMSSQKQVAMAYGILRNKGYVGR